MSTIHAILKLSNKSFPITLYVIIVHATTTSGSHDCVHNHDCDNYARGHTSYACHSYCVYGRTSCACVNSYVICVISRSHRAYGHNHHVYGQDLEGHLFWSDDVGGYPCSDWLLWKQLKGQCSRTEKPP